MIRSIALTIFSLICSTALADIYSGLAAHYEFNGDATDSSGNNLNGTVFGATLTADRFGQNNSAYDFNGSDALINCGNVINSSAFTVSAWINIDTFTHNNYMGPWGQADTTTVNSYSYNLYTSPGASSFGVSMFWADGSIADDRTQYILPIGEWHMISQTFDGTYLKTYDNGAEINSAYVPGTGISNGLDFRIGQTVAYPGYVVSKFYFDGQIDDVRIYNRALSSTEVAEVYAVPEPSTIGLFALIGGGMMMIRRRFFR